MHGSINLVTAIQSFNSAELAGGGPIAAAAHLANSFEALESLPGSTGYLVVQSKETPVVHPVI